MFGEVRGTADGGTTLFIPNGSEDIAEIVELNIGHFLVGEAIFSCLAPAIERMRTLMDEARALAARPSRAKGRA